MKETNKREMGELVLFRLAAENASQAGKASGLNSFVIIDTTDNSLVAEVIVDSIRGKNVRQRIRASKRFLILRKELTEQHFIEQAEQ